MGAGAGKVKVAQAEGNGEGNERASVRKRWKNKSGIGIKQFKESVLTVTEYAEYAGDLDSRAKIGKAIQIVQRRQQTQSSIDMTETDMLNAKNTAYVLLTASAKLTVDPAGFMAGLQAAGCAKDAIMLVYAAWGSLRAPPTNDAVSTKEFEKTNHMSPMELQKTFTQILKEFRRSLAQSPRLKKAKLPLNRINLYINVMDLGVQSLKDVGAQKSAAREGGRLVLGFGKSILTMNMDPSVMDAGKNLVSAGLRAKRQMNADRVFKTVAYIDEWRRELLVMLKEVVSKHERNKAADVEKQLREIRLTLCHLQQVASLEPRWEVPVGFVDLLGDMLQIEGLSSLPFSPFGFAAWLWAGDPTSGGGGAVTDHPEGHDDLAAVSKGSRRLLSSGLPCEVIEIALESGTDEMPPGETTTVTVQCMNGETTEVQLKDMIPLDDFVGLKFWLSFGEPPSLMKQKESHGTDGAGVLQLDKLRDWGKELGTSVASAEKSLEEWLKDGMDMLKDKFATATSSIDEELQQLLANTTDEVLQLLLSRLSDPLQDIDPTDFHRSEAVLLTVATSANAMDDLAGAVVGKMHAVESLCTPILHMLQQAHLMIAKVAKCADPFMTLLAQLCDLITRIATWIKDSMSDLLIKSSDQLVSFIETTFRSVAEAAVNETAEALEEMHQSGAAQRQAKKVDALFDKLENTCKTVVSPPADESTANSSEGVTQLAAHYHRLQGQLNMLGRLINLVKQSETQSETLDQPIMESLESAQRTFNKALDLFRATQHQFSSMMAPVLSVAKDWAVYARQHLVQGTPVDGSLVDGYKAQMIEEIQQLVDNGRATIAPHVKTVTDFIDANVKAVADPVVGTIETAMNAKRGEIKSGVLGEAYTEVHAVVADISDRLAMAISVLEDLSHQSSEIRKIVSEDVRDSVQQFVAQVASAHQMVKAASASPLGAKMLSPDVLEEALQQLIDQCRLSDQPTSPELQSEPETETTNVKPATKTMSVADDLLLMTDKLTGFGETVIDTVSDASTKLSDVEIKIALPDMSALKADLQAAAGDFVEEAEEKMNVAAVDVAELLNLDDDDDGDNEDGMEDEAGAFSSAVVKDGFNLMKSFWADRNARKETWRVRECAAYQALLLMAFLSAQSDASEEEPATPARAAARVTGELLAQVQRAVTQRKAMEPVPAARRILSQSQFIQSVHAAMTTQWSSQEEEVQKKIDSKMQELDNLREDIAKTEDPAEKTRLLVLCKQERKRMQIVLQGVGSVGAALGVVVGFLSDMSGTLDEINGKLDAIAKELQKMKADIKDIKDDLRKLTGIPVPDKVALIFKSIQRRAELPADEVYIDIHGLAAGPDMDFKPGLENKSFAIVNELVTESLSDNQHTSTILVAGQSGSGKSTVVMGVEAGLAKEFAKRNKAAGADGATHIVVRVTLPELNEPLTEMVEETLRRRWMCTAAQITEMQTMAQEQKLKATFLLDGYDELRSEFAKKNLFKTNNLEKWRSTQDTDFSYPKVIIFTRTELLAGWENYTTAFAPLESDNSEKDDGDEAIKFLTEYRIAEFTKYSADDDTGKVKDYITTHVALETRQMLQMHLGSGSGNDGASKVPATKSQDDRKLLNTIAESLNDMRSKAESDDAQVGISGGEAGSTAGTQATQDATLTELMKDVRAIGLYVSAQEMTRFVANRLPDEFWSASQYYNKFKEMKELHELTKTAFMMKIVSTILPRLTAVAASPTTTKRDLLLLLGEHVGDTMAVGLKRHNATTRADLLIEAKSRAGIDCKAHDTGAALDILSEVATATIIKLAETINGEDLHFKVADDKVIGAVFRWADQDGTGALSRSDIKRFMDRMDSDSKEEWDELCSELGADSHSHCSGPGAYWPAGHFSPSERVKMAKQWRANVAPSLSHSFYCISLLLSLLCDHN